MKVTELRDMTIEELQAREAELSEEISRMRIQLALKRLDNPLKARVARRDLARIKTIMREKIQAGAVATPPKAASPDTGKA
jgi:large subunit ribosomal protein L29